MYRSFIQLKLRVIYLIQNYSPCGPGWAILFSKIIRSLL
nr:MAG TPA: hypothetical protein [Caudoviricetes sp.]